jgi:hypothetical protein
MVALEQSRLQFRVSRGCTIPVPNTCRDSKKLAFDRGWIHEEYHEALKKRVKGSYRPFYTEVSVGFSYQGTLARATSRGLREPAGWRSRCWRALFDLSDSR